MSEPRKFCVDCAHHVEFPAINQMSTSDASIHTRLVDQHFCSNRELPIHPVVALAACHVLNREGDCSGYAPRPSPPMLTAEAQPMRPWWRRWLCR